MLQWLEEAILISRPDNISDTASVSNLSSSSAPRKGAMQEEDHTLLPKKQEQQEGLPPKKQAQQEEVLAPLDEEERSALEHRFAAHTGAARFASARPSSPTAIKSGHLVRHQTARRPGSPQAGSHYSHASLYHHNGRAPPRRASSISPPPHRQQHASYAGGSSSSSHYNDLYYDPDERGAIEGATLGNIDSYADVPSSGYGWSARGYAYSTRGYSSGCLSPTHVRTAQATARRAADDRARRARELAARERARKAAQRAAALQAAREAIEEERREQARENIRAAAQMANQRAELQAASARKGNVRSPPWITHTILTSAASEVPV